MAISTPVSTTRTELEAILGDLEDVWSCLDRLFEDFTAADWARKHGADWTFADLPYHLSYFDRELVVKGIVRGRDVPIEEQRVMRTLNELNAWNARNFALRPAGETPEQSVARMRAARRELRAALAGLSDAELDEPMFIELTGTGWMPIRLGLTACLAHSWSHCQEARMRLGRSGPVPGAGATHRTLAFFMALMPRYGSREEMAKGPFTAVMAFTGPGGGAWTIRVRDGQIWSSEGAAPDAELTITQSAETFEKQHSKMANPLWLMLSGRLRVKGFKSMGRFGKIMHMPGPDTPVEPMRERLEAS